MRFPSIDAVSRALRNVARTVDFDDAPDGCDVRLQVYPDGSWAVRWGLSDYDTDHRGYWGASCIGARRFRSRDMARELIGQAREHKACAK